ncbi:hypothetical protein CDL12_06698 [Handroanthus impetiginosus]|uniref:AIPP2-like SPOC-like domain-containing protein n=1 Tax=Handroanthus impetiginosus TaxID=429701 RepID=A0A2G9HSV5_9LAMI|nr:hypothetical protein CDL12_06698 [Handroanthus impetiginosus]
MASQGGSSVRRAMVCLTCGDKGDTTLLIYCRKCLDSAVHHYCMDNVSPDDDNIYWVCWDCTPKDEKAESLRTSKRISSKRLKAVETRNNWKERLKQSNREVQISNEITEAGQLNTDFPTPIVDMETQLLNERQQDLEILQEEKSIPEILSHSEGHNESVKIDELTFATSNLPLQEEDSIQSSDETQKIQEIRKKQILILNKSPNSQDENKTIDLKVPSLVANDPCITLDTSHEQPSLESDDCPCAAPVIDPIWRGCFNIKQESETCVEILAHLSNTACSKVSDAATEIPPTLDIQVLDKCVAWPRTFRISPPTAASIALYFFPACDRDERVFDSLLEEIIERDLALKAMINNSKYFLWGVFRQKQSSRSSTEMTPSIQRNSSSNCFTPSELEVVANKKNSVHSESADHLRSPSQPNQSPLSMNSSQASNIFPSKQNTPDSLSPPPLEFRAMEKTLKQDNLVAHETLQHR